MVTVLRSREKTVGPSGRIHPPAFPAEPGDSYRVLTVVDNGDFLAQVVVNARVGGEWVGDVLFQYAQQQGGDA